MDERVELGSVCLPRVSSDAQDVDVALLDDRSADRSRTEPGEATIVVGAVGSAAPWFLTGWAVDFMIDTCCQVTILATTIFECMCAVDPKVRSKLRPCRRRLVSADPSPLSVKGELELNVVFPGLCCDMLFVVANISSDGYESTTVVPPTFERDTSSRSARVLMVNPNAEEVVLPSFTCVGKLVPVWAISVALADPGLPNEEQVTLPEHLEEIVTGSHPSLGDSGRQILRDLLYRDRHVFPAPREPVTGRTTSVQHEILTSDTRPVCCGPRRLAPAGLQEMLLGCQIEPSDSPWASPVVLVTKKDGSTRFCVDYRRLNALTTKDAYPLPRIDDSLRLLGNQQWFSTMDLASGYWQVAMSPDAKRKAAFVTNEGLFQFRVMPFGLCNDPATFECLMDRVLCGMRWSRCLVYLDDVISFGWTIAEALTRLEDVLSLQLKAKKFTFMQTEVVFLGHHRWPYWIGL